MKMLFTKEAPVELIVMADAANILAFLIGRINIFSSDRTLSEQEAVKISSSIQTVSKSKDERIVSRCLGIFYTFDDILVLKLPALSSYAAILSDGRLAIFFLTGADDDIQFVCLRCTSMFTKQR